MLEKNSVKDFRKEALVEVEQMCGFESIQISAL